MPSVPMLLSVAVIGCGILALVVGRRERSGVVSSALGLLVALALWNGGLAWAEVAQPGPSRSAALRVAVLAMFAAIGFWLLVALRHRWPRGSRGAPIVGLALAPVAVFFVGAVTNASHGWFLVSGSEWHPGMIGWAGPGTWVLAAVTFVYGLVATVIFIQAGLRMVRRGERRGGIALTLTLAALPLVALQSGDPEIALPVSASALTVTTLVLALTALRYQLFEPPPLGHREVIDHLRHGVLIANAEGEILDHNPAAEGLLGFAALGGLISENVARVANPESRGATRRALSAVGETGRAVSFPIEADGGRRTLEVSARPVMGDDGAPLGQIATLRDRTEERRFADAALRTQKLETLGTLAAGIAHEVNNPLAFVRSNLGEIARMGALVEERAATHGSELAEALRPLGRLAGEVQEGLERIQRAVSDVRRLAATPDAGDEAVSIEAIVREAVEFDQRHERAAPRIEVRYAPGLPALRGSHQLLVQAVRCLLLEARRASGDGVDPRIEIETGTDGTDVFVRVRGRGTPEAPPSLAGDPYAAPPDATRVGLGLSVAAGIAHDHGGSLRAEPGAAGGSYVLRLAAGSRA